MKKVTILLLVLLCLTSACSKNKKEDKEENTIPVIDVKEEEQNQEKEYTYFPDTYYQYLYDFNRNEATNEHDALYPSFTKYVFEEDGTGVEVRFDGECSNDAAKGCVIQEKDPITITPFTYVFEKGTVRLTMSHESEEKVFLTDKGVLKDANGTILLTTTKETGSIDYELKPAIREITYNLDGGVNSDYNPRRYVEGDYISLDVPKKEGYEFVGWTGSNGEFPQLSVSMTAESNNGMSFTANWRQAGETGNESSYFANMTYQIKNSLEELNYETNFEFKVPTSIKGSNRTDYILYDNGIAEAAYFRNDELVAVVRKAITTLHLSQISEAYERNETIAYDDLYTYPYEKVVDVKGNGDLYMVADWGYDNYRFSLFVKEGATGPEFLQYLDIINGSNVEREVANREVKYNKVYYSTIRGGFMWSESGQVALIIENDGTLLVGIVHTENYIYKGKIEQEEDHIFRFYGDENYNASLEDGTLPDPNLSDTSTDGYIRYNEDGTITILNKEKKEYYDIAAYNICRYMNGE